MGWVGQGSFTAASALSISTHATSSPHPPPRTTSDRIPPNLGTQTGTVLLAALNEMLARAAVLAQPLLFSQPVTSSSSGSGGSSRTPHSSSTGQISGGGAAAASIQQPEVEFADIALPIAAAAPAAAAAATVDGAPTHQQQDGTSAEAGGGSVRIRAVHRRMGQHQEIDVPTRLVAALTQLGLDRAVGYLRVIRIDSSSTAAAAASGGAAPASGGGVDAVAGGAGGSAAAAAAQVTARARWLPLAVQLGVPLHNLQLCRDVCAAATEADFLSPASRARHVVASQLLQAQLWHLMAQHGTVGVGGGGDDEQRLAAGLGELVAYAELPSGNLFFDGTNLQPVELGESQQAVACFFAG